MTKGNGDNQVAIRNEVLVQKAQKLERPKWVPSRELWRSNVTDMEEAFGTLRPADEVEVLVEKSRHANIRSVKEWVGGVVLALDEKRQRVAVALSSSKGTIDLRMGKGELRRAEDSRDLCDGAVLADVARYRTRNEGGALFKYAQNLTTIAESSHAVIALCRMENPSLAQSLVTDHKFPVTSTAMRELAHAHARNGNVPKGLDCMKDLPDPDAAQLLVEVCALALNERVESERKRLGQDFLIGVTSNAAVLEIVNAVSKAIPQLQFFVEAVKNQPPLASRDGLTEAFNELLQACGRAHAVPVSFRALEWMEAMSIPKDSFTYEAIGVNVVKRVSLLRRVWDLPMSPEESVPEVVFAGRSNVGKSSLVNMLLGRLALAPTSQRPGKTKTMDFFDVNAGHPTLPRFRLVDVPGLGFARVSQDLRQRWIQLIGGYFVSRKSLKIVFHLLDAGLCEILPADRELWKLLAQAQRTDFELCIALTKSDNSLPSQMERFARNVREALRIEGSSLAVNATIFACSSKSKLGKDTLWRKIWSAIGNDDLKAGVRGPYLKRMQNEFPPSKRELQLAESDGLDYEDFEEEDVDLPPIPTPDRRRRILEVLT